MSQRDLAEPLIVEIFDKLCECIEGQPVGGCVKSNDVEPRLIYDIGERRTVALYT